ncbi:hypothetical protein TVAG_056380 [Trichomonas vaginalis G3]|uniref:Uncharacterized protein n=1 Tax=Trichomonas vaginalis (strain ATCC PRA-98 / G3) TaxID=412133 RepID=A2ECJ7_TRIV3|nr:protein ubiquitination [Trichomonas vaginalis G3]EAY09594.1 hypothetical protein TVAG_056380 [Trichomonas vaginalis G3]KAI5502106.1 protein ubiquitination [Trichomonas vaginalis G3]|eukprot:XP_001321817.1 hypothetical protein [Trichomonas vaginalis G3]
MSLSLNIDYIAKNIQTYIDQENFFDIIDQENIPNILEKANLDPTLFKTLLLQGKTKYSLPKLYKFVQKCKVCVKTFEDAINILKTYETCLKLESSSGLIDFFTKHIENQKNQTQLQNNQTQLQNEISQFNIQNAQLMNEIFKCHNENNQLQQRINKIATIHEIPLKSDFDTAYNFLKELSKKRDNFLEGLTKKRDNIKMPISCAVGLSEKRNSDENTILLEACINEDFQFVKSLTESGCDKDAIDKNGNNCLLLSSANGRLDIVKYLIEIGFDKNWRNKTNGNNPILYASLTCQLEIVKYLISIGADPNQKNNNGCSSIYAASQAILKSLNILFHAAPIQMQKAIMNLHQLLWHQFLVTLK